MSTSASVVGIDVNGSNTAQRYILWSNGRIDAVGGAPAITNSPYWYDRTDQPVGVALHISNWATGAGYVLDYTGAFWPINGAATLGTNNYVTGVPQAANRTYIDFVWDPAGSGKGYALDLYGQLYPFGGAAAPARLGRRFGHPVCKRFQAHWTAGAVDKCITLDQYGGLWADFSAVIAAGGPSWPGWDAARDFVVTDWVNGRGYILDLYGGHNTFGGSVVVQGFPYKQGADCGRRHYCLDTTNLIFWVVWDGGQQFVFTSPGAPTVIAGGGTDEVQTVTITGAPTGGTFTMTFGGNTTAATAFNATAATVQTNLSALASIGANNVSVTGSNGGPYTVTFIGTLAYTNVAQMTATSSLTGGSSPAVAVATVTTGIAGTPAATVTTSCRPTLAWSYGDPDNEAQAAWQLYVYTQAFASGHNMTDPSAFASSALFSASGTNPSQRGIVPSLDLGNGAYTFFIRVQNKDGLWSSWSSYSWTQNVSPPATPSGLKANEDDGNFLVRLSCSYTTGVADTVTFQYSDNGGNTWNDVRGAEAVPIATSLTVADTDIPLGVTRQYRTFSYRSSPRSVSAVSNVATATVRNLKYVLTSTADATLGGEVFVVDTPQWKRTSASTAFIAVDTEYPTVVSDGVPKARVQTIGVECDGLDQWNMVRALVESDSTLLFRDPFGDVMYCRVLGDVTRAQQWKTAYPAEHTLRRHNHKVTIPLQEVQAPLLLDVGFTVPPGPVFPTS